MADYDIAAAFEAIENELIDSMMKNFARHRAEENKEGYLWSQWQAEQLKSLEQYRRQNEKKFTAKFSQLNGKVADMLRRARADGSAAQEADILQAIQSGFKGYAKTTPNAPSATFFKLNDRKLDALIKATADDLKSAETAILRMSNDRYRKAIFNAQVYANTGAATYEKAVDMACRDMLRAGLNCVEYKNGARHTLSDYAHMAIRTANKRAYLYGEGQKRQQWGISTVVVNGRRGGCPLCTPYIGRVFIDDVYSGGKRDASSGNTYPLLSEAIKSGLFHPNCKDSTSTYYEGITTLQPVTEEEQAEMERREQLEQRQSYYTNQAKKNRRIAEYSLDADNKRTYSHRAEVFEQKAQNAEKALANSGESGIIESEGVNGLEQAKKRDHKIFITDVAIDKITKSKVKILSIDQNARIDAIHKELLTVSKNKNNSDEVAFLFGLNSSDKFSQMGKEHVVNIFDNPLAYSLAKNGRANTLFLAHNHPSTQIFSYADIGVFMHVDSIAGMSVVSNTGDVHILFKTSRFDYNGAYDALTAIKNSFGGYSAKHDLDIVKAFLKVSSKYGIMQY